MKTRYAVLSEGRRVLARFVGYEEAMSWARKHEGAAYVRPIIRGFELWEHSDAYNRGFISNGLSESSLVYFGGMYAFALPHDDEATSVKRKVSK